jgi:hypothetical protein
MQNSFLDENLAFVMQNRLHQRCKVVCIIEAKNDANV